MNDLSIAKVYRWSRHLERLRMVWGQIWRVDDLYHLLFQLLDPLK
jgi:hypothetical protein